MLQPKAKETKVLTWVWSYTSVMVCMAPQSAFLTVTFLGLRFCSRQGDKWVCVNSGYSHKSNYFLSSSLLCLFFFFQLFLESTIRSVPAPGILARAFSLFPQHVYFIKKSTISESSDGCMIWDSSTAQECADAVTPFLLAVVAQVSDSYFLLLQCLTVMTASTRTNLLDTRLFYFSADGHKLCR